MKAIRRTLLICCLAVWLAPESSAALIDGMVSYWPLDTVQGAKTPDVIRGYDFELVNLTAADLVDGKRGKALKFQSSRQTIAERVHLATDDLPIYKHPNFTVSFWVNAPADQRDLRIFTEGSKSSNTPWFSLGTANNGTGSSLDIYTRNNSNANSGHDYSVLPVLDDTWRHVVYVQQEADGVIQANLYVDAVLDDVVLDPRRPTTLNTTSIGAALRTDRTWYFSGMIDELAVWNRALSPAEITQLNTQGTPTPGAVAQPLAIRVFTADLPAVAKGHTNTIRWDVSKDATSVEIDQGVGNVLSKTVVGLGNISIPVTDSKTYTLTVRRGTEQVTAQTSIASVDGVSSGWALLENFNQYQPGAFTNQYWSDTRANALVIAVDGNNLLDLRGSDHTVILLLRGYSVLEGQQRTLFSRIYAQGDPAEAVLGYMGLTDRSLRYYSDYNDSGGFGPAVMVNNADGAGDLMIGTRNGVWGNVPPENLPPTLSPNLVYNIWIDIKNGPPVPDVHQGDTFSVYLQREGDTQRTLVLTDHIGNRNPAGTPAGNGGDPALPNLDKLMVGNNSVNAVFYDDFYISTSGYNTTVPRPFKPTQQPGGVSQIAISRAGADVELRWATGTLESATSVNGPWTAVQAAAAPSYRVQPDTAPRFFRIR
jgi:hypothetical protein